VYAPATAYVWVGALPLAVVPSPKSQVQDEIGPTLAVDAVASNAISSDPGAGDGVAVNVAEGGAAVAGTITV
jgi:hypothetical protein